jgi:O-methyltransferase
MGPGVKQSLKRLLDSNWVMRLLEVADRRSENRVSELGMIAQAMEFVKINQVSGDYFEFGMWRGKTFKYAHKMMRRYGVAGMTLRGFDSFQGLPAPEDARNNVWTEGEFACARPDLERELRSTGFRAADYELIEGFYDQSLTQELVDRMVGLSVRAAIVYIDCDLYESTRPVLRFIANFLQPGTIVCFDDYYNYRGATDQGEALALAEFLALNRQFVFMPYFTYSPLGQSFIVRMNDHDCIAR